MTTGQRYSPRTLDPQTATEANTMAVNDSDEVVWVELSVPVILLEAGGDASDVPAGTPYGTIVLVKA